MVKNKYFPLLAGLFSLLMFNFRHSFPFGGDTSYAIYLGFVALVSAFGFCIGVLLLKTKTSKIPVVLGMFLTGWVLLIVWILFQFSGSP